MNFSPVSFRPDTSKFEYRYHTADVQIHAHGESFLALLASSIFAIFHYISPVVPPSLESALDTLHVSDTLAAKEAWQTLYLEEEDMHLQSLFMKVLSEALFLFHGYRFLVFNVLVTGTNLVEHRLRADHSMDEDVAAESDSDGADENTAPFLELILDGEHWDKKRHVSGTEIKAITWSNLSIEFRDPLWHAYFIVDI
jgi:SHS2 domain-containing protein